MRIKLFQLSSIIIICISIFFPPAEAIAYDEYAFLFFKIDKESFMNPEYLTIDLTIDSNDKNINATDISVNFDNSMLELAKTDLSESFCDYFISEEIDNTKGKYNLTCGNPIPQSGEKIISHLTFKKIRSGFTKLKFGDNSTITASDGLGSTIDLTRDVNNVYLVK